MRWLRKLLLFTGVLLLLVSIFIVNLVYIKLPGLYSEIGVSQPRGGLVIIPVLFAFSLFQIAFSKLFKKNNTLFAIVAGVCLIVDFLFLVPFFAGFIYLQYIASLLK